jgi:hypothetical protein
MSGDKNNLKKWNGKKFTPGEIVIALQEMNGNITAAADFLGCKRKTVYNYIHEFDLHDELNEARERTLDYCENMVLQHINGFPVRANPNDENSRILGYVKPDPVMLRWFMEQQGKSRGYGANTSNGAIEENQTDNDLSKYAKVDKLTTEEKEQLFKLMRKMEN